MKRAEISNVGAVHIFIAHRIRRPTLSADLRVKKFSFAFFTFLSMKIFQFVQEYPKNWRNGNF